VFLADESATLQFAAGMAQRLPTDAQPFVLYLHGDLGTGKTTLTRGVLRALGEQGAVRSPTYGLITEYDPPQGRVLHLDLYRVRVPAELQALGLADYLPDSRLWMIEWPDKAEGAWLPPADAHVHLDVQAAGRQLQIRPLSGRAVQWVAALGSDPAS
jgi:tRNA threonylcarbamoyladenosine biosynthesis protein TsaE